MTRFYRNLWEKKMSKLDALREAQIWMRREVPKQPDVPRGLEPLAEDQTAIPQGRMLWPYYWAAFVLSGDWR